MRARTHLLTIHAYGLQVAKVLHAACKKESLTMPDELAMRIAEHSGRNVRRALLTAEACRVQQYVCDTRLFARE